MFRLHFGRERRIGLERTQNDFLGGKDLGVRLKTIVTCSLIARELVNWSYRFDTIFN